MSRLSRHYNQDNSMPGLSDHVPSPERWQSVIIRSGRRVAVARLHRRTVTGRRRSILRRRRLIIGGRINRAAIHLAAHATYGSAQQTADGRTPPGVVGIGGDPQGGTQWRRPDPHPSAYRDSDWVWWHRTLPKRHGQQQPHQELRRLHLSQKSLPGIHNLILPKKGFTFCF